MKQFFEFFYNTPILFELLAALLGIFYITKYRDLPSRYFVFFLCFTFVFEVVGYFPHLISENFLSFLKGTKFEKNYWLYNPYLIVNFLFYAYYFRYHIRSFKIKKVLGILLTLYLLSSLINLIFSDVYFVAFSAYTFIIGAMLILFVILIYFFEILKSDEILYFNKILPFYVAVGALVFHLGVTPLFIYSKYYSESKSPDFVQIYRIILTAANIFMYTCYTIGFIICLRKNKSY